MSLFAQIRDFVGKIVNNPIKSIAVAYLLYRILKTQAPEQEVCETVQVKKQGKNNSLILDTDSGKYILVSHDGNNIVEYDDEKSALQAFPESVKVERLYERVCLREEYWHMKFNLPKKSNWFYAKVYGNSSFEAKQEVEKLYPGAFNILEDN